MSTTLLFEAEGQSLAIEFDATLTEQHSTSASVTEHPVERGVSISDHVRAAPSRVRIEGMITNTPLVDVSTVVLGTSKDGDKRTRFKRVGWMVGGPRYFTLDGQVNGGTVGTSKQTSEGSLRGGGVSPVNINGFGRPNRGRAEWVPSEFDKKVPNGVSGTRLEFPFKTDRVKEVYTALDYIVKNGILVRLITDLREYPEMLIESVSAPRTPMDAMIFSVDLRQVKFVDSATTKVSVKSRVENKKDEKKEEVVALQGKAIVLGDEAEGIRSVADRITQDDKRRLVNPP